MGMEHGLGLFLRSMTSLEIVRAQVNRLRPNLHNLALIIPLKDFILTLQASSLPFC
jgi:hypothetical protein